VEGVTARSASCAIVLHSPGFCEGLVLGGAQACWVVVRCLVGNMSAVATAAGGEPRPTVTSPEDRRYIPENRWSDGESGSWHPLGSPSVRIAAGALRGYWIKLQKGVKLR
jgi:hypothetical protein